MSDKLNPPQVEEKIMAQYGNTLIIPFLMNRAVGMGDFKEMIIIIKSVQNDSVIQKLETPKNAIYYQDNHYRITFNVDSVPLRIGQYYKAQLAYKSNDNIEGFYSKTMTFKYTSIPNVQIKNLNDAGHNIHKYSYTGIYTNVDDPSEKVYSYEFNLYNSAEQQVASSGQLLHNSAMDTEANTSIDEWTVKFGLKQNQIYTLVYSVYTINGLKFSSPAYYILDNQTVPSDIFDYYDFTATPLLESACVELSIQPRSTNEKNNHKKVNGKFVLLRSSSEDNYDSWYEMTRFILSSWDTGSDKIICRDYSVSQGVGYKYGIQVYNDKGIYSTRKETSVLNIDFEDTFLSDGKKQLRIRFNPKISSIKNTILESKTDTLGGKYPFFFRNGNVKYKELPISGLISMLMDENEEFIKGIHPIEIVRESTPSQQNVEGSLTDLTSENFRKEREFKHAVLEWLTNGEPKLFRSPGEGNFIVRLMNTSLTPNDTLSRMLHSFSCTAYEIDDFTFENLRKYNMLMDESIETRDLQFHTLDLTTGGGHFYNLNACMATVRGSYGTVFQYRLQNNNITEACAIGSTGTYVFDKEVLKNNLLMEIWCDDGISIEGWSIGAKLDYATYKTEEQTSFSYINSLSFNDVSAQWIGSNEDVVDGILDPDRIIKTIGLVHSLKIRKRLIVEVDEIRGGKFYKNNSPFFYGPTDILKYDNVLYDGRTGNAISGMLDCTFNIYKNEKDKAIDLNGPGQDKELSDPVIDGLIVYTNLSEFDYLYLGNGVYAEILYQEIEKEYTVETTDPVKTLKKNWKERGTELAFNTYYTALKLALDQVTGGLIINAL